MQYIDLISGALAYHINLPVEKVKDHFSKSLDSSDKSADLLRFVMSISFPTKEGNVMLEDLKSKSLQNTLEFMLQSLQQIKQETVRQSIVN